MITIAMRHPTQQMVQGESCERSLYKLIINIIVSKKIVQVIAVAYLFKAVQEKSYIR